MKAPASLHLCRFVMIIFAVTQLSACAESSAEQIKWEGLGMSGRGISRARERTELPSRQDIYQSTLSGQDRGYAALPSGLSPRAECAGLRLGHIPGRHQGRRRDDPRDERPAVDLRTGLPRVVYAGVHPSRHGRRRGYSRPQAVCGSSGRGSGGDRSRRQRGESCCDR